MSIYLHTKTNCSFSRTIEEAATFLKESFHGKGFTLKKELGAGSIGATYIAENTEGADVVVKMIKKGVSRESLEAESKFIDDLIMLFGKSPEEISNLHKMNKNLYKGFIGELDLVQCMKNGSRQCLSVFDIMRYK